MNTLKEVFNQISLSRAEKFTNEVRAGKYEIPVIQKGLQKSCDGFKVGDTVETTESSNRKAGSVTRVTGRYKQHGYWYYQTSTMGIQRQQDLKKVK